MRKEDVVFVQKMETFDRKGDVERGVSGDIAYWKE